MKKSLLCLGVKQSSQQEFIYPCKKSGGWRLVHSPESSPVPGGWRGRAEQGHVGLRLLPWSSLPALVQGLAFPNLEWISGNVFWAERGETAGATAKHAGRAWSCWAADLGGCQTFSWDDGGGGGLGKCRVSWFSTLGATASRRWQRGRLCIADLRTSSELLFECNMTEKRQICCLIPS